MTYEEGMAQLMIVSITAESYDDEGYRSAPILCAMSGCTVETLLETLLEASVEDDRSDAYQWRDRGAIRWCREQLRKPELRIVK